MRRHLDVSQKAAIALEIMPMLEKEAKQRQRDAGLNTHSNQYMDKKVQLGDNCHQAANESESPEKTSEHDHEAEKTRSLKSAELAAQALGISGRTVTNMKHIAKVAPEQIDAIKQGKATAGHTPCVFN